jgi:hypothetical protein
LPGKALLCPPARKSVAHPLWELQKIRSTSSYLWRVLLQPSRPLGSGAFAKLLQMLNGSRKLAVAVRFFCKANFFPSVTAVSSEWHLLLSCDIHPIFC